MSPIEHELYVAMLNEGLSPEPQVGVKGYFVDFAFEDIKLAIEADGSAYHTGERQDRDRQRDFTLGQSGWTVKRFRGCTIHDRAANCAFVIKKEVEQRMEEEVAHSQREEDERRRSRSALLGPFRRLFGHHKG